MSDAHSKGPVLTRLARGAIAEQLEMALEMPDPDEHPWLLEPGATFVTLFLNGALRGCIGSLEAHRPLIDDVRSNAVAAAFHDPRFSPLTMDEYGQMRIEVSLLGELEEMHARTENIALSKLRPNVDGVVFKFGMYKATFLPQVWEQLPDPVAFMRRLKEKAGLSGDFWHPEVLLYKYQVQKYRESEKRKE